MPRSRRSLAISRPMLGTSSSLVTSAAVAIFVFILKPPEVALPLGLLGLHDAEAVLHRLAGLVDEALVEQCDVVHAVEAEVAEVVSRLTPGGEGPRPAPERQGQG